MTEPIVVTLTNPERMNWWTDVSRVVTKERIAETFPEVELAEETKARIGELRTQTMGEPLVRKYTLAFDSTDGPVCIKLAEHDVQVILFKLTSN